MARLNASPERRQMQLFSQESTQTLREDVQAQQDLQTRFERARDPRDRRVTFSDLVETEEEDLAAQQAFDDASDATTFAAAVHAHPQHAYDLTGGILTMASRAAEERNILFTANEINLGKLTELTTRHKDALASHHQALDALQNSDGDPTALATMTGKYQKSQGGLEFWRKETRKAETTVKEAEAKVKDMEAELAQHTATINEMQDDLIELEHLRSKVKETTENRGRGKDRDVAPARNEWSLSMERRLNGGNHRSLSRHTSRGDHRSTSRRRSPSRRGREETTFTTRTKSRRIQRGAVFLDDTQERAVLTSRDVKEPEKFSGVNFYQWLQSVELKLDSSTFRTMEDALRWVHSWTKDDVWAMLDPSVPSSGSYTTKTVDPFATVDELLHELSDRYGDEHQTSKMRSEFERLRQGDKESFQDFHLKFRRLRAHLGKLSPSDEVWELKKRLNYTFRSRVAGHEFAGSKDLEKKLKTLEVDLDCLREDLPRRNDHAAKDRDATKDQSKSGATNGPRAPGKARGAMPKQSGKPAEVKQYTTYADLPDKYKKLPFLDRAERDRCRTDGRCHRCREQGHNAYETHRCAMGLVPSNGSLSSNATSVDPVTTTGDSGNVNTTG